VSDRTTRIDWWIWGVPVLALLHLTLFTTLHARPGRIGVVLWHVGIPALAALAVLLLLGALARALRRRQVWSRVRVAGLAALAGLATAPTVYRVYPSSHDARPSQVHFRLPMDGPIRVAWGGDNPKTNYHTAVASERWAYDLLVTRDGSTHRGNGLLLADYYAWDKPVRAPAAGTVQAASDGEEDVPRGERFRGTALGNHVVIEVAPREFVVIAHLRRGSVRVRPEMRVQAGEEIGRAGNSGNTTEPHVHIHLQDAAPPALAEGIPMFFHGYRLHGAEIGRGMPRGGRESRRYVGDEVEQIRNLSGGRLVSSDDHPRR
jgi:hypothetical protein